MVSGHSIHAYLLLTVLRRAPRRTQLQGSRAFHLLHNIFTDSNKEEAARQLATVSKKAYPRADDVSLKLVDPQSDEVTTMTLSQALQRLEPLSYLAEAGPGVYRIQSFPHPGPIKPVIGIKGSHKPFTRAGRGKEFHLTTSCTPQSLHGYLLLSYKFILEGTRMEFHLHQRSRKQKHQKHNPSPTVDWALAHCMHLRPDSILAAMPEGTTMVAEPAVTDLSYKKKPPKFQEAKSQVMWALENEEALRRANVTTPQKMKKVGKWSCSRSIEKLEEESESFEG